MAIIFFFDFLNVNLDRHKITEFDSLDFILHTAGFNFGRKLRREAFKLTQVQIHKAEIYETGGAKSRAKSPMYFVVVREVRGGGPGDSYRE